MDYAQRDALQFIEDNDVKFVRLFFCDIFGVPKSVAIMASRMAHAFEYGAGFDVSAVEGFMNIEESDLLLHPDPKTLTVLPWRPSTGRVARMYCDIRYPDGSPFAGDGRHLLRQTLKELQQLGITCRMGTECEFYLFELDEKGEPTLVPQDTAGYLDIAPLDKGENVRREVCLALDEMGLFPEGSHHEKGPGQNEIWCRSALADQCADDFITYKTVVRTIAAQNGLYASFMPKPFKEKSGTGLHINISLYNGEENLFAGGVENETANAFMAGVLDHIAEITFFLNTTTNSYHRFGSFEAPKYISWAVGNRAQLLRVPSSQSSNSRVELRSPDPLCNPYLAFTLLLRAGMKGIQKGARLGAPANFDFSGVDPAKLANYPTLPQTLGQAIEAAANSLFVQRSLPPHIVEKIIANKQYEWESYLHAQDKDQFEHMQYFQRL
ncbi:MAG: glutamine synthetase family protein [Oscillospiraceae bacterium]